MSASLLRLEKCFRLRVRVDFARRELAMTDKLVAESALSGGLSDQSQLTKTFKRVAGRTPAAYRAQHR